MADVITAAKQDIAYLIFQDRSWSALFLKMVFHDCVGGGCDGCINMSNPDNHKLDEVMTVLTPVVDKYAPLGLSRPDLWVLASYVGVEMAMPDTDFLALPFTTIGRHSCSSGAVDESMAMMQGPNPEMWSPTHMGTDDILGFFRAQFGFTPQETAAIMGAHTM